MRYERKYRIEGLTAEWVTQIVKTHPASFQLAYPPRQVNNIYFDTPNLDGFKENSAGIPERKKYRLRWYGQSLNELSKPVFEVKIKDRELGYKQSQKLDSTIWTDLKNTLTAVPQLTYLPLQPILVNSYHRSYYLSKDGRFRITIDKDLVFAPFQWNRPVKTTYPSSKPAVILELKYEAEDDDRAQTIFDTLPFRLTKNSKYMEGINMILE